MPESPHDLRFALSEEQSAYLSDHTLAVLATGRADASPQVSTVMYDYDGENILISIKSYTAKWKNALRQPRVALCINEGRKQMIVYGQAECIDSDPERVELTRRVFEKFSGQPSPPASDLIPMLDEQKRTVLRIRPERAFMGG